MSKELVEKKQSQLAVNEMPSDIASQELDSGDFVIPRILLMQGTSTLLSGGEFNLGDIVHATEERILAKKGETVEILPFYVNKTYETFKSDGGDWVASCPWGASHAEKEWEETIDIEGEQVAVKNVKNYNIYVLLTSEEDSFPCIISFRSTAGKEAKKITSHFILMNRLRKPAYNVAWKLGSEMITAETTSGKKAFQKYTIKKSRNVNQEELETAANWLEAISQNISNVVIADAGVVNTSEVSEMKEANKTKKKIENHAPKSAPRTDVSSVDAQDGDMPF